MTREDEYTLSLSSGKIVMLISGALSAMLACFVAGLVIGKSLHREVPGATSAPASELSSVEQPAPKISLPEIPKSASPPAPATAKPPVQETKKVAEKPAAQTPPKPVQLPTVSAPKELYAICVISVRTKNSAQDYANQLAKRGYKASVMRTQTKSGTVWYRTIIGEFPNRKAAEQQLVALKSKGEFKDAFVISK